MNRAFLLFALLIAHSPARAELMVVELQVVQQPDGGWRYVVKGDGHTFDSDAELGEYLKGLSNPLNSIFLTIESADDVPASQLCRILALAETNPQGIAVKTILLDIEWFNRPDRTTARVVNPPAGAADTGRLATTAGVGFVVGAACLLAGLLLGRGWVKAARSRAAEPVSYTGPRRTESK